MAQVVVAMAVSLWICTSASRSLVRTVGAAATVDIDSPRITVVADPNPTMVAATDRPRTTAVVVVAGLHRVTVVAAATIQPRVAATPADTVVAAAIPPAGDILQAEAAGTARAGDVTAKLFSQI